MIRYCLKCKNCSVEFESWFSSSKEFDRLKKLKHINCQICNSIKIEKSLMSPNITNTKKKTRGAKNAPLVIIQQGINPASSVAIIDCAT